MIPHDLEKAWAARPPHGPILSAPTFAGDRLMIGAQTEIAVARKAGSADTNSARERDARMIALLSAAYGAPVSDRALAHLRRALEKRAEGDVLLASTHLALTGYWPLRDPLAAKRVFFSDGLLRRGATPAMILAALDLDPRRLDALERFDPNQPRVPAGNGVESGRWTRDDGGTGENEVVVGDKAPADHDSLFSEDLPARVVQGLIRLAARSWLPAVVFGTLFIPSAGKSGVTDGNVPGRTDLRYRWDKPDGQVQFYVFIDGHWVFLTAGRDNLNEFYRDDAGNVIARAAGDALVVDLDALDRTRERLAEGSGGQPPRDASSGERGGPKLCPDRTSENTNGRSALSIAYQQYVSGLPAGFEIKLGSVRFDGCRESDGFILEAKANYYRFLAPDGQWKTFFRKGAERLSKQLLRQSDAAALAGRQVEWHVLQKPVADKIRDMVAFLKITNIKVIFDPGPWR